MKNSKLKLVVTELLLIHFQIEKIRKKHGVESAFELIDEFQNILKKNDFIIAIKIIELINFNDCLFFMHNSPQSKCAYPMYNDIAYLELFYSDYIVKRNNGQVQYLPMRDEDNLRELLNNL